VSYFMIISEKQHQLDLISSEINSFKGLAIAKTAIRPVPGEGNPDSPILFIGEAPGRNEDLQGRPFVGLSGKLLEKTLYDTLGLQRSDVFITNIVKYRPPDNRDPTPEEIESCRDWLDRQIAIISPQIIVTLGRFSMAKFIPDVTISKIHGQPRTIQFPIANCQLSITVYPMYHPAAALRAGSMMTDFVADFVKLGVLLKPDLPTLD
jgi:uracil-DNA glycosylase